jgi:Zn-finger nucleic acid-binding protein
VFELPYPETEAGQLACPKCSANVAATNHACEFCGAELLVKACPRCFARVFHGAKHCSGCGAEVVQPAAAGPDGTASKLHCPRCEEAMTARLVGDTLLDECGGCHGVWVDVPALERILSERQQARADAILGMRGDPTTPNGPLDAGAGGSMYIKCPECANLMNRRNFSGSSGVIVDVCKSHGTWFDQSELQRVVQFAMDGGMERSQRKEAERTLAAAKRERDRAKGYASAGMMADSRSDQTSVLGGFVSVLSEIAWWM